MDLQKIIEFLCKLPQNKIIKFILMILIFTAFILNVFKGIHSELFTGYFGNPRFRFREDGEKDIIRSDIQLGDGLVIVSTYILVKYGDKKICIVEIKNYYDKNYVSLYEKNQKDIVSKKESEFVLEADKVQRHKRDEILEFLKKKLNEGNETHFDYDAEFVYIAEIQYQNLNREFSQKKIWIFKKGAARKMDDYERGFWDTDLVIDLDCFEEIEFEEGNPQIVKIVDICKENVME